MTAYVSNFFIRNDCSLFLTCSVLHFIQVDAWMRMNWTDQNLVWDPADYDGLTQVLNRDTGPGSTDWISDPLRAG